MFRDIKKTLTASTADTSTGPTAQPPLVRASGSPNTAPAAEVGGRGNLFWRVVDSDVAVACLCLTIAVCGILAALSNAQ